MISIFTEIRMPQPRFGSTKPTMIGVQRARHEVKPALNMKA